MKAKELDFVEVQADVLPSEELTVSCMPFVVESNIERLSNHIDAITRPFFTGEIDVSTPELEEAAKVTLSELNKVISSIDTRRKNEIARISAPITEIDNRCKEIITKAKAAYRKAKDALDEKVAAAEDERYAELKAEYEGIVGEQIVSSIPFDNIANKSWATKSYGMQKAKNELFERAQQIVSDMKVLADQALEYRAEVIAHYCRNVSLNAALAYERELKERKAQDEALAKEAEVAFKVEPKPEPQPEVKPEPAPVQKLEVEHVLSDYVLILRDISVFDAQDIATYAQAKIGKKPELKNKKWLERVVAYAS